MCPHIHAHARSATKARDGSAQTAVRNRRLKWILPLGLNEIHANDIAQNPLFDELDDHPLLRHAKVIFCHLKMHAITAAGINDDVATGQGQRHRLFHHDVFAVLCDQHAKHMVKGIAYNDIYGHDVRMLFQHLLDTGVPRNTIGFSDLFR